MFHADVKEKAKTDASLSEVYAGFIPGRVTLPAVAYVTNFADREATQQDAQGTTRHIVTFYIMATSYDALEQIASDLHAGFNGFGGDMGDTHVLRGTKLIADETAPETFDMNGQPAFLRTMSFSILHR